MAFGGHGRRIRTSARTPPGPGEGQGRRRSSAGPPIGDQRQNRTICNAPERMLQRARDATAQDHQGTHRRAGKRPGSLGCLDTLGTKIDSLRLAGRSLSEMGTIIATFAESTNSLCPWCGLNGAAALLDLLPRITRIYTNPKSHIGRRPCPENRPVRSSDFSRSVARRTTEVVTTNISIRRGAARGMGICPENGPPTPQPPPYEGRGSQVPPTSLP